MMKKRNLGEEVCVCLFVCLLVSKSELERTGGIPVFIDKIRNFHGLKWCCHDVIPAWYLEVKCDEIIRHKMRTSRCC